MNRTAMACVFSVCCIVIPAQLVSQTPASLSDAWNQELAAEFLDARAAWWRIWPLAKRDHDTSCASCHSTVPYALARSTLRLTLGETGPSVAEAELLGDTVKRVNLWNEIDPYYPDQRVGLPKTSESRGVESILNALVLSSRDAYVGQLSNETRQAFANMWKLQFTRGDLEGGWAWLYFDLAPWESEDAAYFGAAMAAVAVGIAPENYANATEIEKQLESLREYLLQDYADRSAFDKAMLLWASAELSGLLTEAQTSSIVDEILSLQNRDGGWGLALLDSWGEGEDGYIAASDSDGYATGLIAFALQKAGVSPRQAKLDRAIEWLVRNQNPINGNWPASSLNKERDPTTERGLLMSDAATAFAVLALKQAEASYK
ncbi:MAG: hypothetical protein OXU66_11200 [Gammaproteobacteria bacterium]|nr:hypothetical protein [Gammaproteobacteria bacterium]